MNEQLKIFDEKIRAANKIAIMAHKNLDGDALCSMLALGLMIEINYGKTPMVIYDGNVPDCLDFVPVRGRATHFSKIPDDASFDLAVVMDYGNSAHIGGAGLLTRTQYVVEIDHHRNDNKIGNLCVDDESAAATAEILYRIATGLGWSFDLDCANLMATALMTDTGNFRFVRNGAVLRIMADLVDRGVNVRRIMDGLNNKPRKTIVTEARVAATAEFLYHGRLALATISNKEYKNLDGRGETVLNLLGQIRGVEYIVLLKQQKEMQTGVSLRSRHCPVDQIAMQLGGGGHERAAGAVVADSLENVRKRVLELFKGV